MFQRKFLLLNDGISNRHRGAAIMEYQYYISNLNILWMQSDRRKQTVIHT
jgi:hypothetical protein